MTILGSFRMFCGKSENVIRTQYFHVIQQNKYHSIKIWSYYALVVGKLCNSYKLSFITRDDKTITY